MNPFPAYKISGLVETIEPLKIIFGAIFDKKLHYLPPKFNFGAIIVIWGGFVVNFGCVGRIKSNVFKGDVVPGNSN